MRLPGSSRDIRPKVRKKPGKKNTRDWLQKSWVCKKNTEEAGSWLCKLQRKTIAGTMFFNKKYVYHHDLIFDHFKSISFFVWSCFLSISCNYALFLETMNGRPGGRPPGRPPLLLHPPCVPLTISTSLGSRKVGRRSTRESPLLSYLLLWLHHHEGKHCAQ